MSYVRLLAADRPAPLYQSQEQRVRQVSIDGQQVSVEEDGFAVLAHEYYRQAVEELGLSMKPYQYELDLRAAESDLRQLRAYLAEYFAPGEEVELWGLWVGGEEERPVHYCGSLEEFDMETLKMLEEFRPLCLTIKISSPGRRNNDGK